MCILAFDGCHVVYTTNATLIEDYNKPRLADYKGYNHMHLNGFVDVISKSFLDVVIQPGQHPDEREAMRSMLEHFNPDNPEKYIITTDRGYESYDNIFLCELKKLNYVFRVKAPSSSRSLLSSYISELPDEQEEFDVKITDSDIGKLAGSLNTTKWYLKKMIDELTYLLTQMSYGNISFNINYDYKGEFEPIKTAFEQILVNLNDSISKIQTAGTMLYDASEQVSGGSQALAQGTSEQEASIRELSDNVEDISGRVNKNAENAKNASEISDTATDDLKAGNEEMQQMLAAMKVIEEKSAEIEKIINTIDNIAFQTNILALNAAVEAARAGEAGKGFAVVADEVRNLASKSAEAAQTTSELIGNTIEAVSNGMAIADTTAQKIQSVMDRFNTANALINEISDVSAEQAKMVEQVLSSVGQISAVVQNNAATAQESASASAITAAQAKEMQTLVKQFHLRENGQVHLEEPSV